MLTLNSTMHLKFSRTAVYVHTLTGNNPMWIVAKKCAIQLTSEVAKFSRYIDNAASTAPPPGTTFLESRTRFTTHNASCRDRSISSNMKSFAPRRMTDAADLALGLNRRQGLDFYT